MTSRDRYGCTNEDDACLVRTFAARADAASRALARNAAQIDETPRGTPGSKATSRRRGRSAS